MSEDAQEIAQRIIDRIDEAWKNEGCVPGEIVTEHAFYTNLSGRPFRGRAEIVEGTRRAKATFQAEVTRRELIEARRLADGVILAVVSSAARIPNGNGDRQVEGLQSYVIVQEADAWRVAAYQNTQVMPNRE